MKKIIALIMMVSFITVNTAGAFAAQRPTSRDRVSGRVEQRNTNRGSDARRQERRTETRLNEAQRNRAQRSERPSINRSSPLNRRQNYERPNRPVNRDVLRRGRPITRPQGSFFNRSRFYNSRPFSSYRSRPYYGSSRPYYGSYRRNNSISPLEFFGIGAAIIAIAAAASHAHCDY